MRCSWPQLTWHRPAGEGKLLLREAQLSPCKLVQLFGVGFFPYELVHEIEQVTHAYEARSHKVRLLGLN